MPDCPIPGITNTVCPFQYCRKKGLVYPDAFSKRRILMVAERFEGTGIIRTARKTRGYSLHLNVFH